MLKRLLQSFTAVLIMLVGLTQAQADNAPLTLMQTVASQTLAFLHQHKSELQGPKGDEIIHSMVDRVLVPHIDAYRMAGAVVGRQYWTTATQAQKDEFITQFKTLVISTYSSALASYDDDIVQFYPLRTDPSASTVQVRSKIVRKTGQQIAINYNMIKDNNQWLIYDFSIEGISMIESYRSQFAGDLAQGGLPVLIQQLRSHNRSNS